MNTKNLVATKLSVGTWWLVKGEGWNREVCAKNSLEAKKKAIQEYLEINQWLEKLEKKFPLNSKI
jgi:hypothetical protein